ncbi:MAG: ribonuclease HII [Aquiluna sp.]|nr:ribonuclease HII [Aquiluna sp.]
MSSPTLEIERSLLEKYDRVIGIDEVGRGALAGPVAVGAFTLDQKHLDGMPTDLRDSKLVPEKQRAQLAHDVAEWGHAAVGYSSVEIIENYGINRALQLAALDALNSIDLAGAVVLLDGSHNWLGDCGADVVVKVKADRDCGSVSAGAIAAKVARDELMVRLAGKFPEYGWAGNKGYSSASHILALQSLGPTEHHRLSWLSKILSADQALF